MRNLTTYNKSTVNKLTNKRAGETKVGERIILVRENTDPLAQLAAIEAAYVVFGIAEDRGVVANQGRPGTKLAWNAFLKSFLNIQHNKYSNAEQVVLLGHLDFDDEVKKIESQTPSKEKTKAYQQLVEYIDKQVAYLVSRIVKANKIPVIIGGGHNNAYGTIKGCALALGKPINVLNLDAHTDLRPIEGRHSGNGFSYAMHEGFLNRYFVFGLHENYTSQAILDEIDSKAERIRYNTFEAMKIRKQTSYKEELKRAESFITKQPFGLEIDCDAIQNMPSSAMTPSGFSVNNTRNLVDFFKEKDTVAYLHICEAAPDPDDPDETSQVGKLLSYLVSDFIKKTDHG